jgi:hypothetical protein
LEAVDRRPPSSGWRFFYGAFLRWGFIPTKGNSRRNGLGWAVRAPISQDHANPAGQFAISREGSSRGIPGQSFSSFPTFSNGASNGLVRKCVQGKRLNRTERRREMAAKAEILKGAVDSATASRASRSLSGRVAGLPRAFRAWGQARQIGPDRSRELGRHLGARC